MKKYVLLPVILMCAGCFSHTGQFESEFTQRKKGEDAAWLKVYDGAPSSCQKALGVTPNNVPRDKAVDLAGCYESKIRQEVLPVAVYPDLVLDFISEQNAVAQAYSSGKIDNDGMKAGLGKTLNNYQSSMIKRVMETHQQLQGYDRQIALQNMQYWQTMNAINAQNQANARSYPTTTNCFQTAVGVTCNSM